ncbi:MAG: M4 family metallopeptidase [bacterium]|nr:M4 family metallopeptidase [bacterium]
MQTLKNDSKEKVDVKFNGDNGTVAFLKGAFPNTSKADKMANAIEFIGKYKELFKLSDPSSELKLNTLKKDKLGMTHLKLDQFYKGIPVWASQLIVHFDKNSNIYMVNGRYESTPLIDILPTVSEQMAISKAKEDLKHTGEFSQEPTCKLTIYHDNGQYFLAWQVNLKTDFPQGDWEYFIDAKNSNVIFKYNNIKYDGETDGTGILVNGDSVNLSIYEASGSYYLANVSKPMWKGVLPNRDTLRKNYTNGTITAWDCHDKWRTDSATLIVDPNGDKNFNDNSRLPAGVSAQYNMDSVYTYYYNTFGRNSWNDSGASLLSVVHYLHNYNNASWNGRYMVFGDGDDSLLSCLAGALDVTAHEMTHAVIQSTADLVYLGQHGALNEAFSDFFGCMIDREDWLTGEDCYTPGTPGDALRDLTNPHNGGNGTRPLPVHMREYIYYPKTSNTDNGGVHYNMLIPAHAGYLMSNLITKDTTEQLWYRALTTYLVQTSYFIDLRYSLIQSAIDLYPSGYSNIESVIRVAFDSVGIVEPDTGLYLLAYDDSAAKYHYYPGYTGNSDSIWSYGVRFQPVEPCTLKKARVMLYKDSTSNSTDLIVSVYTDDYEGYPFSLVYQKQITTSHFYPDWEYIDLDSSIAMDEEFYVAVSSPNPSQWLGIAICTDSSRSKNVTYENVVNYYDYTATDTGWTFDYGKNKKLPGDLMINAYVYYYSKHGPAAEEKTTNNVFVLYKNYPNPFSKSTNISYYLPTATNVSLKLYDISGRCVKTLVNEIKKLGHYTSEINSEKLKSGIYFAKFQAGDFRKTQKLVLMK